MGLRKEVLPPQAHGASVLSPVPAGQKPLTPGRTPTMAHPCWFRSIGGSGSHLLASGDRPGQAGGTGESGISAQRTATMGHGWVSAGVRRVPDGLARAPGALRGGSYDGELTAKCPRCPPPGRRAALDVRNAGNGEEAESSGSVRFPDSDISDQRKQRSRAAAVRSATPPRSLLSRTGHSPHTGPPPAPRGPASLL